MAAETPHAPAAHGGPLGVITRKVGPLPVWAYAGLLVLGYLAYRHFHPSSSSSTASTTDTGDTSTSDQSYVPPFDAADVSGGIGSTGLPSTVNNYYYGTEPPGGGTASGAPTGTTVTPVGTTPEGAPPASTTRATGTLTTSPEQAPGSYVAVQPPRGKVVAE
jgi:hypothetical protein